MTRGVSSHEAAGLVLREADRVAWRAYVALERLKAYSPPEQRRFAEALLDGVGQRGTGPFTIRHPMWNEYVFPVLLERRDRRDFVFRSMGGTSAGS